MYTKGILAAFAVLLMTSGCQTKTNKEDKTKPQNSMETSNKEKPLDSLLNTRRVEFAKVASDEKKKVYGEGTEAVKNSGILDKALNVGDKVPDFTLNNQMSKPVSLYKELEKGPVVLIWYRGGWCPYCNITLHYLQERLPDITKAGGSLMALTPELPDKSMNTTEKHSLDFLVLSDIANKVGKEYGVVFELTPEVAALYQEAFDLHGYNGDESNELPLAATYVIDQKGIIQYAFLDADYRNRAEPDDIIAALEKIKTEK
jgi:peroxiredoxin